MKPRAQLNHITTLNPRTANWLTRVFLALLPFLFFWRETLGWMTLGDGDAVFSFYPLYTLVSSQLRALHLPLWNPYLFSGMPLFEQWQVGALDPLNWIYLLGVTSRTLTTSEQFTFSVALLATFAYARSLGLKRRASVVAAVIYALSGFMVARTMYPAMPHAAALTPLVLYFLERLAQHGHWRDVFFGALVVAWQIFTAHPQPFVYSSLLAGGYAVFRMRNVTKCGMRSTQCVELECGVTNEENGPLQVAPPPPSCTSQYSAFRIPHSAFASFRIWFQCALMFAFGLGLAAVQWWPAWSLAQQSARSQTSSYEFFTMHSLHPASLLTALFPFFHGQGKTIYQLPYWGTYWHHNEAQIYLGTAAISLAAAGALYAWRERWRIGMFWSVVGVVAMVLSLGKYAGPIEWALYRVPLINSFRSHNRHWMEVTLAVAVLAGYTIDRLLRDEARSLVRAARITAGALTVLCAVVGGFVLWRRDLAENVLRALPDWHYLSVGFLHAASAEFYLPIIGAVCALIVLVVFTRAQRRERWYALLLVFLLLDFNLYAAFAPIDNLSPQLETLVGRAMRPELAAKQSEREPSRYYLLLHPLGGEFNPFWFYGHEMVNGYDPLVAEQYKTFSMIDEAGRGHLPTMLDASDHTLDLLNVRYVLVSPKLLGSTSPSPASPEKPFGLELNNAARWRAVPFSGAVPDYQDFRAYENLQAMPRVWLVNHVEAMAESEQLRLIRGEMPNASGRAFDPHAVALVEPEIAARLNQTLLKPMSDEKPSASGTVKIISRGPNRMRLEVEATQPCLLVQSEMAAPGWRAKVDGREAEWWRVDYLLRGVALDPGAHTVEFVYRPRALMLGAVVSITTALVLLLLLILKRRTLNSPGSAGILPARFDH